MSTTDDMLTRMLDDVIERERERESTGIEYFYFPSRNLYTYSPQQKQDDLLRLRVYEKYFGLSWRSACYPLDPRLVPQNQQRKYRILSYLAKPLFRSAIPEDLRKLDYNEDVSSDDVSSDDVSSNVASLLTVCDGDHLIRRDGERVVLSMDTFSGKQVLVCCFNAPVLWRSDDFQPLLILCHELASSTDSLVMVMVARMNKMANTLHDFSNFYKAFPPSCLAVPYEDSERRDQICKLLNLGVNLKFRLYDTDGTMLPPFGINYLQWGYGAEAFPFDSEILKTIAAQRRELRKSSLDQLLRVRPCDSPPTVYKFNPADGPREEVYISDQIRNKHVGLYMCSEGSLIPFLHKSYEHCRSNQHEFEIVVLYSPFWKMLDPEFFKATIDLLMQEQNVCGWWCLPFNNSISLRLDALTHPYVSRYSTCPWVEYMDKLIIVGPDGKILDMYGAEVIKHHEVIKCRGIDAYPFTREAHVKEEIKKLREITLESILVADVYRGSDRSDTISAGELVSSKKKVIVFMAILNNDSLGKYVRQNYVKTKNMGTEFEMVFINNLYEGLESREMEEVDARITKEMPWFVYPFNGKRTSFLKYLRKIVDDFGLIGFGEDGRVCAFEEGLYQHDPPLHCLSDTLYKDLYRHFGYTLNGHQH